MTALLSVEGSQLDTPVLEVVGLSKSFGGVQAISDVSLSVPRGAITSVIGPNGAGKTSLFNIITGVSRPSVGKVWFRGEDVTTFSSYRRASRGMARTFQNVRLFPSLNVLENVLAARYVRTRSGVAEAALFLPRDRADRRIGRQKAQELLERVGIGHRTLARPRDLPYGEQRRVEIARALITEPILLLLDEPTAGMTHGEAQGIMDLVVQLREDGTTIFLIEHNMHVVMSISDTIGVLNFGRKIAEGTPAHIRRDTSVIEAYLGPE